MTLAQGEVQWVTAVIAGVELLAVKQRAPVVDEHFVTTLGLVVTEGGLELQREKPVRTSADTDSVTPPMYFTVSNAFATVASTAREV